MKQLPEEYAWGIDIAIKKLRPGCSFGLGANTISDWQDPNGLEPPAWEEVMKQMEKDKLAAEKWAEEN